MGKCMKPSSELDETSIPLNLKPHGMPLVISAQARKLPHDLVRDSVNMGSILFSILRDHQVQARSARRSPLPCRVATFTQIYHMFLMLKDQVRQNPTLLSDFFKYGGGTKSQ